MFTWKCASRHNGVHFFANSTSKSGPNPGVLCTFWLRNMLRATTACSFSTSQLRKVVRAGCVLYILTSKCASRHNGVHCFDNSTSKSGPNPGVLCTFWLGEMCFAPQRRALFLKSTSKSGPSMVCFVHFDFKMCFAPQRRALFRHRNSKKCLRTRRFSEPTFRPSGATKPRKNTVNRNFPTFSRTCIFFLLIFSPLTLLPADCFFISPYCRRFDFQTSFDSILYINMQYVMCI